MTCRNCGHANPAEARFCGICGSMLEVASTPIPSPPVSPPSVAVEYAGFWIRFVAWVIDLVVIVVMWLGITLLARLVSFGGALAVAWGILTLFAPWLYYVLFTGTRGQTLGKMALGIKVVREDGQVPGLGYAALREVVGKFVSTIALFLGFLWIAWDPKKQGWHDKIAGTRVIRVRK